MKIACLGWGSLIWKAAELPVASDWFADGPWLPIEFAREGDSGELATVICEGVAEVQVLWSYLAVDTLDKARDALREREGVPREQPECIGSWPSGPHSPFQQRIAAWAAGQGVDAVVWTALPPRSGGSISACLRRSRRWTTCANSTTSGRRMRATISAGRR